MDNLNDQSIDNKKQTLKIREVEKQRIEKEEQRLITEHRPQRSRIFKSDFLESFTLVRWQTIFVVWIPVIGLLFFRNYQQYRLPPLTYIVLLFSGVLLWSLAEYLIHRFPFHLKCTSELGKKLVYQMHGNHHDDPFDPLRGVMPIVPGAIYLTILYTIFYFLTPVMYLDALFASFMIGYLCYDGIHYWTHHGKPKTKLGRYIRKIHLVHHVHAETMFGISSPLWDFVFGTYMKKNYTPPKEFEGMH